MKGKIIFHFYGQVLTAFSPVFLLPAIYAAVMMKSPRISIMFLAVGLLTAGAGIIFWYFSGKQTRRLPVFESSITLLTVYPIVSIFGVVPFVFVGHISPINALLETVSDFTSAGLSILPEGEPYVLLLWQSLLMWFGSLIFLILLVTVIPEVNGNFGTALSLGRGKNFSPMFGQMSDIAGRVIKTYFILTGAGFIFFKLAGLKFWDSLLMSLRCISTGGGDFFPGRGNLYVEYAACAVMILACGNFLLYSETLNKIFSPLSQIKSFKQIQSAEFVKNFSNEFFSALKVFFTNSEVKVFAVGICLCTSLFLASVFGRDGIGDGNDAFRYALFHVVSFASTTGITISDITTTHDFGKFLIFAAAICGGSIGSATGGIKIMRILILLRFTGAEIKKTLHPRMVTGVSINKTPIPGDYVSGIFGFFFLSALTLFVCAGILSMDNLIFSEAVAMTAACLTNVGSLPGLCGAENFLQLSIFGKFFCMIILIVGRVEIFALPVAIAGLKNLRLKKSW